MFGTCVVYCQYESCLYCCRLLICNSYFVAVVVVVVVVVVIGVFFVIYIFFLILIFWCVYLCFKMSILGNLLSRRYECEDVQARTHKVARGGFVLSNLKQI